MRLTPKINHTLELLRTQYRGWRSLFAEYENAWHDRLRSCAPADRAAAESAVCSMMGRDRRVAATRFRWFESLPAMEFCYRWATIEERPHSFRRFVQTQPEYQPEWEDQVGEWEQTANTLARLEADETHTDRKEIEALFDFAVWREPSLIVIPRPNVASPLEPMAPQLVAYHVPASMILGLWFAVNVTHDAVAPDAVYLLYHAAIVVQTCLWWCPFENAYLLCDYPTAIDIRPARLTESTYVPAELHRDSGPAAIWRDGTRVWALNNVLVPRAVAETPASAIDPQLLRTEKRPAVRGQIVRKIGMPRVCKELHARVVDRQDAYELLHLDVGDPEPLPFLKMVNPSTGETHIEGIPPNCTTVADALAWRNQTTETPQILT